MVYKEIVIGVLKREQTVCLSIRQSNQSFAGCWEFPGGKLESRESMQQGLQREFREELAIETFNWQPLMLIPWHYESVSVRLNVFTTEQFSGEPKGNEGQAIKWWPISELDTIEFPQANRGLIMALQLADKYMISGSFESTEDALGRLQCAFSQGIKLGQLRAKNMSEKNFVPLANRAVELAHKSEASLLLNGHPKLLDLVPEADGIQLASNVIFDYSARPISSDKLLGVSTHTEEEIKQALKIGADFILLSPVKETSSHPGVAGIGWDGFAALVKDIPVPVFALGGMKQEDVELAKQNGGQGVAAISGFWPAEVSSK